MRKINFFHSLFCASLLLLFSVAGFAQLGSVRGFVYDKANGEPILFVNVALAGTTFGSSTDVNGYFSIVKVPPGKYTIKVMAIGYDSISVAVDVAADEIVTKKLYANKRTVNLREVEISAEKEEQKTEVKMSVIQVTPKEISQIPSIGADPDIAQYLQVVPGIVSSGDQGGQLYIRGGTPIQNKVLLDGMIIYNPFHSIGLFSVFDTDILKNADVYTGGFGAEYAGRISSVMDIKTKDGNKKRFSGKISGSPFTSKLVLEGPLKKQKTDEDGAITFLLSGKTSYLDKTSTKLYPYVDEKGLPYSFNDLYAKLVFSGSNGSKFNLFGFSFNDKVDYQHITNLDWNSVGFGSNFIVIPGGSTVLLDGNFAYSQYKINLNEADGLPRYSLINGFNMGLNFTYFLGKDEVKYGIEILGFKTDFSLYNYVNQKVEQTENTSEFGTYFKYKKVIGKLVIDPSIRLQYYASLSEFTFQPRLGLKYNVTDKIRLKAAGGFYAQNLLAANSDRDVVNLFYGFLSGPENIQSKFDGNAVDSRLQKARHLLAGVEVDLGKHLDLNVEGYIKDFYQLYNLNRDKIYADVANNSAIPDSIKKDFIIETGLAKGIDVTLKYEYRKFYFWLVYSLSFSDRYNGSYSYMPHFDRRHNINLTGTYTFGKNLDWEIDARWNFGSGFPFTQTAGFYPYLNFQDGLFTNITNTNGQLGLLYGDLNAGRLPYYHRLDITIKKTFVVSKHSNLEVVASVINAYNRQNIFYFDRIHYKRVDQLPVIPSLGASLTF